MKRKVDQNNSAQVYGEKVPKSLLSGSNEEKLKYFRGFTVAHPVLQATFDKLWRAILDPQPGTIIMIYGPAGVGKTTLCGYLEKRIRERFSKLYEADRELIPLVKVEASHSVNGNFDWKGLFQEILLELCEPGTFQKIDTAQWESSYKEYQSTAQNNSNSPAIMRRAVEKALKHRRPKGVLIDEAQHLCVNASARRLVNQPDSIKSIAGRTKTNHILFGSYDLLAIRNLNGQLARRVIELHFSRYNMQVEEDVEVFKNILTQFQDHLPMKEALDLVDQWELLYSRTLGCIGILKETLNRALSMALDEKSKALELKHLKASMITTSQANRLIDEIENGEYKLQENEVSQDSLLARLKADRGIKRPENLQSARQGSGNPKQGSDTPKRKPGRRKGASGVGDRNPIRDKVGAA